MDKPSLKRAIEEMDNWLIEVRRDFHKHPELGNREFRTAEMIKGYLTDFGIEFETYPDNTCVVGILRGAYSGKTIAIRADMDALPITESNSCDYASQNTGVMHACGHDAHTTILLGTAKYFASVQDTLHGNIKFLFQPNEESDGGAKRMIEAGCLQNPTVEAIFGLHVIPNLPCGKIETKAGIVYANSDVINITINGIAAHGAHPDEGVDAIVIAAQVINALQTVVSRNVAPTDSVAFTIGKIHGGVVKNVITDKVQMTAILRTIDRKTRLYVMKRIDEIINGISISMGGSAEIEFIEGYSALYNDAQMVDIILSTTEDILGKEKVALKEKPTLGGEDFCYFAEAVQGAYYHLGCGNVDKGITAPLHNEHFDIDEDCLKTGVMLHAAIALRLLEGEIDL